MNDFAEKAKTSDGFVFGSPVYYAHPSGRIQSFLDRLFFSTALIVVGIVGLKLSAS